MILLLAALPACVEQEEPVGTVAPTVVRPGDEAAIPIADLVSQAERYREKSVLVRGKVRPGLAFQFVNEQPYEITDKSGSLWVITSGEVPAADKTLSVRGEIITPYQIKGHRYDMVLMEQERLP